MKYARVGAGLALPARADGNCNPIVIQNQGALGKWEAKPTRIVKNI
jgi:hypothetical protein